MELISFLKPKIDKRKEWSELAKEYKADELIIIQKGESFKAKPQIGMVDVCKNTFGYELIWKTKEDDIHVWGDNKGVWKGTSLYSDNRINCVDSLKKLELAIACFKKIEANRKKYY